VDRHPRAAQRPTRRSTHHVVGIQVVQQWRMGLQGVRRSAVVPLETCADRSGGSGGGSARGGRRPASYAGFCRGRAGVDEGVADQPHQCRACTLEPSARSVHRYCSTATAGSTATATTLGRTDHRACPDSRVHAPSIRAIRVGHARDRGDSHPRHPGADECDATSATQSRQELLNARRRAQGRMGTLVGIR
jgi:hypothetical protein